MPGDTSRWSHAPVNRVVPYHWIATTSLTQRTGVGLVRFGVDSGRISVEFAMPTTLTGAIRERVTDAGGCRGDTDATRRTTRRARALGRRCSR